MYLLLIFMIFCAQNMQWCSYSEAMHKTGKDIEDEDLGLLNYYVSVVDIHDILRTEYAMVQLFRGHA